MNKVNCQGIFFKDFKHQTNMIVSKVATSLTNGDRNWLFNFPEFSLDEAQLVFL